MQWTATPRSSVRFRPAPPFTQLQIVHVGLHRVTHQHRSLNNGRRGQTPKGLMHGYVAIVRMVAVILLDGFCLVIGMLESLTDVTGRLSAGWFSHCKCQMGRSLSLWFMKLNNLLAQERMISAWRTALQHLQLSQSH